MAAGERVFKTLWAVLNIIDKAAREKAVFKFMEGEGEGEGAMGSWLCPLSWREHHNFADDGYRESTIVDLA
jgi:hypothetical protein